MQHATIYNQQFALRTGPVLGSTNLLASAPPEHEAPHTTTHSFCRENGWVVV